MGNAIERGEGVNLPLQNMVNGMINKIAKDKGQKNISSSLINNFWIKFSVMFHRNIAKQIIDHYPLYYYLCFRFYILFLLIEKLFN